MLRNVFHGVGPDAVAKVLFGRDQLDAELLELPFGNDRIANELSLCRLRGLDDLDVRTRKSCLTLKPLRTLRTETRGQTAACPDGRGLSHVS